MKSYTIRIIYSWTETLFTTNAFCKYTALLSAVKTHPLADAWLYVGE